MPERDRLSYWAGGAMYFGIGLSLVGAVLTSKSGGYGLAALVPGGFVLAALMMYLWFFGLRCPRCGKNLGGIMMVRQWHLMGALTHCRYCGAALDEETAEKGDPISN